MKNYLLFITFIFLCSLSFASGGADFTDPFFENTQKDTSKVNIYELQKIKYYPNPASTYLYIDYDVIFVKEAKLQIYNSIGAVVYTKTLTDKQDKIKIYVSELENGLYFCSLKIDGNLINTRKILINH